MQEIRLESLTHYIELTQRRKQEYLIFRGVSDSTYRLESSFGRRFKMLVENGIRKGDDWQNLEAAFVQNFTDFSFPLIGGFSNDWEKIAMMQHHGLPTRLLDWSSNPIIGLFFATSKSGVDGSVYVFQCASEIILRPGSSDCPTPIECNEVRLYMPRHTSPRMNAQSCVFTFHPGPLEIFEHEDLTKIQIPMELKSALRNQLAHLGIDHYFVFQDLDNLCKKIKLKSRLDTELE